MRKEYAGYVPVKGDTVLVKFGQNDRIESSKGFCRRGTEEDGIVESIVETSGGGTKTGWMLWLEGKPHEPVRIHRYPVDGDNAVELVKPVSEEAKAVNDAIASLKRALIEGDEEEIDSAVTAYSQARHKEKVPQPPLAEEKNKETPCAEAQKETALKEEPDDPVVMIRTTKAVVEVRRFSYADGSVSQGTDRDVVVEAVRMLREFLGSGATSRRG